MITTNTSQEVALGLGTQSNGPKVDAVPAAAPFSALLRLDGRTAIVTGASRGIGAATAEFLADMGADVVISSRDLDACERQADRINSVHPGKARAIAAHGGREEDLLQLASGTLEQASRIDILVNNAATNRHFAPVLEADRSVWDQMVDVNLRGPLLLTRAVVDLSMRQHGGVIVNVASIAGLQPTPRLGLYGLTKAGMVHLTRQLSQELGPTIRVNGVAPGLIKTRFAEALWTDAELVRQVTEASALGRLGAPAEVAATVAFLASDAASYIAGQVLLVDGGAGRIGP